MDGHRDSATSAMSTHPTHLDAIQAESIQPPTASLLQQEQLLAKAKAERIGDLLNERVLIAQSTEKRLAEIADELKSLGWHRTREARAAGVNANNKKPTK
jgi:hypothetical protein